MAEPLQVVVIDDEPSPRKQLILLLKNAGCEIIAEFEFGDDFLQWLSSSELKFDALFLDIGMPEMNGVETLKHVPNSIPAIFVTGHGKDVIDGLKSSAISYILKPATKRRLQIASS